MQEHVTEAAKAAQIAVAADVPWRIKREWLSSVAWFAALPDPSAKLRQRFATPAFVASGDGEHEHVVPRVWLRDTVLHAPEHAEQIFGLAVACNVTKPEHRRLSAVKDRFGWERYIAVGLTVVDTADGHLVDLDALAREQRKTIERLGLPDPTV